MRVGAFFMWQTFPVADLLTPCREWQGAKKGAGYGNIYRDGKYKSVHRHVWELVYGPVPKGMVVMHACDNPPCFRLDHLKLGTQGENMADKVAKGRARGGRLNAEKTHCPQGHVYDEANTYRPPERPHARTCRTCQRQRVRPPRRKKNPNSA
jgi:hypothetical protein